jgi:response regulator RpfG family c-di-GMP phosphodiesterase
MKTSLYLEDSFIGYFQSSVGSENMIYLEDFKCLSEWDKYLIDIYCTNVSIAFDNIYLNKEVENTQKEIIYTLGEITENRSKETGCHVRRVAEYSRLLALKYGLSESEAEIISLAAPMHDIGKLGIPDSILNKPDRLTSEEFEIEKGHTLIGHEMLKKSSTKLMKMAAIIALQHHEKYNGKGYPHGLKGEEIHLYARITSLADVFDALDKERVYKKAWELEKTLELLKQERGQSFSPELVDIFFENLDEILKIRESFSE